MSPKARSLIFLFVATFIFGCSFPIGRAALDYLTPLAYGGLRFLFGALSLLPLALRVRLHPAPGIYSSEVSPYLWIWSGILAGACLSVGSMFQLYGMAGLPASQVGFITTLYVSLVPILAFILGYMPRPLVIIGLGFGLLGLYFLTGGDAQSLDKGVGLILVADVFWATHVLIVGHFACRVNTWLFSLAQALTSAFMVLSVAFWGGYMPSWHLFFVTLPYTLWGIFSVGVAFTCQALGQKNISSSSAALIFPLQSVIGAVAGVIFLNEIMTQRMIMGAAIIIFGCLIAQFARESVKITPEHKYWQKIYYLRLSIGALIGVGTLLILIWALY